MTSSHGRRIIHRALDLMPGGVNSLLLLAHCRRWRYNLGSKVRSGRDHDRCRWPQLHRLRWLMGPNDPRNADPEIIAALNCALTRVQSTARRRMGRRTSRRDHRRCAVHRNGAKGQQRPPKPPMSAMRMARGSLAATSSESKAAITAPQRRTVVSWNKLVPVWRNVGTPRTVPAWPASVAQNTTRSVQDAQALAEVFEDSIPM